MKEEMPKLDVFERKVVVITGATGGLGSRVAEIALESGGVVYAPRRGSDPKLAAELDIRWYDDVDVRDTAAAARVMQDVARKEGRVDLLFPMAANIFLTDPKDSRFSDNLRESLDVNYRGVVNYVLAFEANRGAGAGMVVYPGTVAVGAALGPHAPEGTPEAAHNSFAISIEPYTSAKAAAAAFVGSRAHDLGTISALEITLGCNLTPMLNAEGPQIAEQWRKRGLTKGAVLGTEDASYFTGAEVVEVVLPGFNTSKENISREVGGYHVAQAAQALANNPLYRQIGQPGGAAEPDYKILS